MRGHPADRFITVAGETIRLRFTLGALAQLSSRLDALGPQALAVRLRQSDPDAQRETACILVDCLSVDSSPLSMREDDLVRAMPVLADMIVEAFS